MLDLILGLTLATAHVNHGYEWRTPGAYVVLADGTTAGAFRNSMGRRSLYLGQTWGRTVTLTVGTATGYQHRVTPFAALGLAVPLGAGARLRLNALPRPPGGSAAVNLSIESDL